jgi:hypothetical protein
MNELMNKVFSDVTVWKTMGNTKALSITFPGLQPDAMRLQRLKAYGYACCLYVVTEHALPPALSVLFAYALLAPLGEYVAINNIPLVWMYVPKQAPVLDIWPLKAADFKGRKPDATLTELTLQYFNEVVRFRLLQPTLTD